MFISDYTTKKREETRRRDAYLAINKFLDRGKSLFSIDANADLLAFVVLLNSENNRGDVKIAKDRVN